VIEDSWIEPGVHINAVGSNIADRRELPGELVKRASVIAVDALDAAKNEAGDLIIPDCWSNVVELQQIKADWSADGISIFKSVGLGMEDVAVGSYVYEQAIARGAGKPL
jgi:ornithine cyclodeaminase/alanine dehydrogenase-like protein (mu-crystallin family)